MDISFTRTDSGKRKIWAGKQFENEKGSITTQGNSSVCRAIPGVIETTSAWCEMQLRRVNCESVPGIAVPPAPLPPHLNTLPLPYCTAGGGPASRQLRSLSVPTAQQVGPRAAIFKARRTATAAYLREEEWPCCQAAEIPTGNEQPRLHLAAGQQLGTVHHLCGMRMSAVAWLMLLRPLKQSSALSAHWDAMQPWSLP